MREDFSVEHDGRKTNANVYWPEKEGKVPAVIFSHGYNENMENYQETAEYYSNQGFAFIRISFCGGGPLDTSGYPSTEMSILTEIEDLYALFNEISSWERIDKENIFLFGDSMGGLVSALTAAKLGDKVKALLLLFPALGVPEGWAGMFAKAEDMPEPMDFMGLPLGRKFYIDACKINTFETISAYEGPVLIMHGLEDPVAPYINSEKALTIFKNAKLRLFHKEGHGFSDYGSRRMEAMAMSFIEEII